MAPSLDSLPNDIQYMIFSYLAKILAGYALDGVPRTPNLLHQLELVQPKTSELMKTHPFQNLAATSRQLRQAVEGYCRHLLDRHKDVIGGKPVPELGGMNWEALASKNASGKKKKTKASRQTYRNIWIRAMNERCVWCGKKSQRKAVFDMLIYCCYPCDLRVYGRKVAKSDAIKVHGLKPLVWLRPDLVYENSGLKPLKIAFRMIGGNTYTFLRTKDAVELSEYCKQNDPTKSVMKKAVRMYGIDGQKLDDENRTKEILFWDVHANIPEPSDCESPLAEEVDDLDVQVAFGEDGNCWLESDDDPEDL